jgi:epoxyqueuosine reductase
MHVAHAETSLAGELKAEALRLGFDAVGIAPAVSPPGYARFLDWLEEGCAAGMAYLGRRAEARAHPRSIHFPVRSVVVAAMVYGRPAPVEPEPRRGKVARYARGQDYHRVLWDRLDQLLNWLRQRQPGVTGRSVVDTAPLLERDYARLAGLGWIAKNTMLIHPRLGSFTVLGALLTDCELDPDAPFAFDRCGTCTRCLEACPTSAFTAPGRLDARRCISYWTIEHRGPIPDDWADQLHGWVFGCDICQDVCPWNRKAPPGKEPALEARAGPSEPDLVAWLEADSSEFREQIRGTALERARRVGLVRNAALILGTRQVADAVGGLIGLLDDPQPVIRAAAAWALGRFSTDLARASLIAHRQDEDESVRAAIDRALGGESPDDCEE